MFKKVILIIIPTSLVAFGIPFIVNCLFNIPENLSITNSQWNASDLLNYLGAIIGSYVLFITVYMTIKSSENENKLQREQDQNNFKLQIEKQKRQFDLQRNAEKKESIQLCTNAMINLFTLLDFSKITKLNSLSSFQEKRSCINSYYNDILSKRFQLFLYLPDSHNELFLNQFDLFFKDTNQSLIDLQTFYRDYSDKFLVPRITIKEEEKNNLARFRSSRETISNLLS